MLAFPALRKTLSSGTRGSLFYLCFFLSMGSFAPFLNVYYKGLGFNGRQIGILSVFFPLMMLVFATPISALADRRSWRVQILQLAIGGGAVFIFFLKYPHTYLGVAATLLLMSIAFSPLMSIADSLVVNMAKRKALNYGSMRLWGSIGFASSATLFGMVFQRFGFGPMFTIGCLLMIPLFIVAGTLEAGPGTKNSQRQPLSGIVQDKGLVILIGVSFLMGISNSLSMSFDGIYVQYLGGGNALVGAIVGVSGVSEIITMQYGQKIAQRLKSMNALSLSLGMMGIAYVGYVLAISPWMLVPAAILRGLGFGLFFTNIVGLVNERAPDEWVTTAQSLRAVAMFGLAPLLAGPLGGLIHDLVSPSAIFGLGSFALGIAVGTMWIAKIKRILA